MKKEKEQNEKKEEPLNSYVKFAGLGIQMVLAIVLMTFGGVWLDSKFESISPFATIVGSLIGVFIALYVVYKEVKSM
ncbi:Putative F0F1-ATPase subunit Ca2+/Mg2+ transporter [Mesonia phycicola]|uniref:Putative F0F1-ATPase subunit Ca2+/Mg2+ transporter n=1 Tax=Mesonia phycicola TaxID=579105 RepID=A0A1M6CYW4_9FLAO|nr:AtpZ/AtpI family protein [Mesonia phycicola]SHI66212.1 Putative F0F1-ATPase subunit Ca2+/Mg2+ transporter [Mesonia phycicola]